VAQKTKKWRDIAGTKKRSPLEKQGRQPKPKDDPTKRNSVTEIRRQTTKDSKTKRKTHPDPLKERSAKRRVEGKGERGGFWGNQKSDIKNKFVKGITKTGTDQKKKGVQAVCLTFDTNAESVIIQRERKLVR